MFERFTERAKWAVVLAQEEARRLGHDHIDSEHLLLGLLREEEGVAARTLEALGVSVEDVRAQVAGIVGPGEEVAGGEIPLTPQAKRVLEVSLQEARALGHGYIGTEHILLGLLRENRGVTARVLEELGADAERIRSELLGMLAGSRRVRPRGASLDDLETALRIELEGLEAEREAALDRREFEEAARLRGRQRQLLAGREDMQVLLGSLGQIPASPADPVYPTDERPWAWQGRAGLLLGALGLAVGLLVGWLVWGS